MSLRQALYLTCNLCQGEIEGMQPPQENINVDITTASLYFGHEGLSVAKLLSEGTLREPGSFTPVCEQSAQGDLKRASRHHDGNDSAE